MNDIDEALDNYQRARRARKCLDTYHGNTEGYSIALQDLITDTLHFYPSLAEQLPSICRIAVAHYETEKTKDK